MVISPRFLNMMTQLNISLSEKQLEQFVSITAFG